MRIVLGLVWGLQSLAMCVRMCCNQSGTRDLKFFQSCFRCLVRWCVGIILRSAYIWFQENNSAVVRSIVAVVFAADDQDLAQV